MGRFGMNKTLDRTIVQDAIDNNDSVIGELSIYESYSGRGMFGESCFGVVGSMQSIAMFISALTAEIIIKASNNADSDEDIFDAVEQAAYEATNLMHNVAFDNMGLDTVAYWPGWTLTTNEKVS